MSTANKSILELPEIKDTGDYWVLGTLQGDTPDKIYSGRFLLSSLAKQTALQLERRIPLVLEASQFTMLITEQMTLYRVDASNTATITISGVDADTGQVKMPAANVTPNSDTDILIPSGRTLVTFSVTRTLTDATAYLFIYAKAILP